MKSSKRRLVHLFIILLIVQGIALSVKFFHRNYSALIYGNSTEERLVDDDNLLYDTTGYYEKNAIVDSQNLLGIYSFSTTRESDGVENNDRFRNIDFVQFLFNNSFKSDNKKNHFTKSKNKSLKSIRIGTNVFIEMNHSLIKGENNISSKVRNENVQDTEIYGTVNKSGNYAVFSTTTSTRDSISFIFYLPLTVLAWKRVGFESLIIIVGSHSMWSNDPLFSFVLEQLNKLGAVLIFLGARSHMDTMLSQVSRIYAGNMLYSHDTSNGNIYLLTTDADLWPLKSREYMLPSKKVILSLNAECCAPFKHRGRLYRMLPMSNIGMRIENWHKLTRFFFVSPSSVDEILTQVVKEFGSVALRPTHKGDNVGWFLDQMLISMLIAKWSDQHPNDVKFTSRNIGLDRIDRNAWSVGQTIEEKLDVHLPENGYRPEKWKEIAPLLELMYGKRSSELRYCDFYYKKFIEIIGGVPLLM